MLQQYYNKKGNKDKFSKHRTYNIQMKHKKRFTNHIWSAMKIIFMNMKNKNIFTQWISIYITWKF